MERGIVNIILKHLPQAWHNEAGADNEDRDMDVRLCSLLSVCIHAS